MKNMSKNLYLYVGDKKLNRFMGNMQLNDNGMKLFGEWYSYTTEKINKTYIKKLIKIFKDNQDYILGIIIADEIYWFNNAYKVFSNGYSLSWKSDIINDINDEKEEIKL